MLRAMLLAQLEAFIEVARAGNVSRAAEILFVTQPALTARLKTLESELGGDLFVRTPRGMRLNDAGRAFLPYAQRALGMLADGRSTISDHRAGRVGELLIGAAPAISTYLLPSVLGAFTQTHPNVRLGVRTGHTEAILDLVLAEQVHIGLGRAIRHHDIDVIPLYEDRMMLVTGRRHAFAQRGATGVRLAELARERLILFDRTSSYYELTSSLFRQAGVVPESVIELDNIEAAKKMVQLGLGVALLPRMALENELRSGTLRPIEVAGAATLRRPLVAFRRRDAGPAAGPLAAFIATLEMSRPRSSGGPSSTARR